MSLFLPDTNACSRFLRGLDPGLTARWLASAPSLKLSAIVFAELQFGVAKLANTDGVAGEAKTRLWRHVKTLIEKMPFVPFTEEDGVIYGRLRAHLERRGETIGPNDLLIAAQTLRLNGTLVSHNVREFSRVPNLKVEDWQSV